MSQLHKNIHKKMAELSRREQQVLLMLVEGRTDDEMAEEFNIKPHTIRKHLQNIAEKLGLRQEGERRRSHRSELMQLFAIMPGKEIVYNQPATKRFAPLTGVVPLSSPLYLERNADRLCKEALTVGRNGGLPLIRIKGSSGMGKSSLLIRLRQFLEKDYKQIVGFVDLGSVDFEPESFANLNQLLRRFTYSVAKEFKDKLNDYTPPNLQDYWREDIAPGTLCTDYLKDHIFAKIDASKTLLIDGVDAVLGQKKTQNPFLNLLRTWNEQEMKDVGQEKIVWPRIAIAYSTEPYPEYGIKGSILQNVGIEVELEEFSADEVKYLAAKYGLNWSLDEVKFLMNLIGGHPTLVNQALYQISQEGMSLSQLKEESASRNGPFRDHLLSKLELLEENEPLLQCLQKILKGEECRDEFALFQLEKAGLICNKNDKVRVKFELYQKYFEAHI